MAAQANRTRGARHRVVSRAEPPLLHRAALRFRDGTLVPPSGTAIAQDGLATRQTGQLSPHPYHRHMLLVIDVGNTNLTLGVVEAGLIVSVRRAATPRAGTADEVELLVSGLLALDGRTLAAVERVAIASVVPVATAAVATPYSKSKFHPTNHANISPKLAKVKLYALPATGYAELSSA